MSLQFGVGFGQDQDVHNIAEYCCRAEELGYAHATMIDMGALGQEVNVMMTVAALGTGRIHIGHGVTNPATYHPGAIANATASLRELTDNRAFVGIGAGGPYGQYLKKGVLMTELREAVKFIQDYSAGREGTWQGGSWHSEWIRNSKWVGQSVPVYVAVAGPKTCQIAGEFADAVFTIGMDPELQKWRMEQIEKGAEKAGRDPKQIDIWIRTQCYLADSKEASKQELEPYAATCTWEFIQILKRETPAVSDLRKRIERRHPGILEEFRQIFEHWDPYWTERIGGPQTKFVSQRVIDFFLATGQPDQVSEQIEALRPLGIKGISAVMFSIQDDLAMLERLAKEVMPRFG